jgi:hypothetical protein
VKIENRRGYEAVVLIESRRVENRNLLPYQEVLSNSGDRTPAEDVDSLQNRDRHTWRLKFDQFGGGKG